MVVALLVGACWGFTNTLVRVGVLRASQEAHTASTIKQALSAVVGHHWAGLLTTPSFVVPQALNWAASAVFVAGSKLHVATPVANSTSIAATAATARVLMGDRMQPALLSLGVLCVGCGVALTAT